MADSCIEKVFFFPENSHLSWIFEVNMRIFPLLFYVFICVLSMSFMAHKRCTRFLVASCAYSDVSWMFSEHETHLHANLTNADFLICEHRTVHLGMSLEKGFHVGCLWCARPGEETCVVSERWERWCVKARLICLWLALIKVSPRRALNTHRDSVMTQLQCVSYCLCLLFSPMKIRVTLMITVHVVRLLPVFQGDTTWSLFSYLLWFENSGCAWMVIFECFNCLWWPPPNSVWPEWKVLNLIANTFYHGTAWCWYSATYRGQKGGVQQRVTCLFAANIISHSNPTAWP